MQQFCYEIQASSRPLHNVREAKDRLAWTTKDFYEKKISLTQIA
jgi:hypothetical protein